MNDTPTLGVLLDDTARRDCIHVALAPVVAGEMLLPGEKVCLRNGKAISTRLHVGSASVGVVDPFLVEHVLPGQRFYLLLNPGSVTSMRHLWQSPHFPPSTLKEKP